MKKLLIFPKKFQKFPHFLIDKTTKGVLKKKNTIGVYTLFVRHLLFNFHEFITTHHGCAKG
jgi:hypothetical protein